ncbi:MAG: hydrogenase maturation nickel metallochaperone HypA [Candidatus Erginobacter occultus]|nr:hydrogenase maturation nickel metallochaperone HypA [Candidatus Erginobacter occultus]
MHEWTIADNLVRLVGEAARKEGLTEVSEVYVKVGVLRQVIPETLKTAFSHLIGEIEFAGAELKIEKIPLAVKCRDCGSKKAGDDLAFTCGRCGGIDLEILAGDELYLDYLEGKGNGE